MRSGIVVWGIVVLGTMGCQEHHERHGFAKISSKHSGVDFANQLTQSDTFNIIEYLYFYNGGGVAAGDINNDGLTDLYFTGNQVANKLYLNKGDFKFEDITGEAGVGGTGNWTTGVTMADVNGDGWLDIFVCGVGKYKQFNGRNQLYINNGDLTFTERAEEYGLGFQGFSTQAAFFDYDNDGDLDLYLLNHSVHSVRSYDHARVRHQSDPRAGDKLYRNALVPSGRPHFEEVTSRAGIYNSQVGYGLAIAVSDLNRDGYADIYVSNDFHENDYLYINKGDGTFKETVQASVPHTSRFSMGSDVGDINNDGWPDIVTLDMLPRDEEIIKTTAGEDPYDIYTFKLGFGYHHQLARNTLQLNRGVDPDGQLFFSDIALLAGVEATDWSWAALLADFDNDARKDLFVTNGILNRPNDLDYINFIASDSAQRNYDYKLFVEHMPGGEVPNRMFRNAGGMHFTDVTPAWIGEEPSLSSGAVYVDLDNDGDLDLVLNNINAEATLYRNDLRNDAHWLQLSLEGDGYNTHGIGAKVIVYAGGEVMHHEQMLSRGWQSSVSPVIHMGLDKRGIDSLITIWPDGRYQVMRAPTPNQRLRVRQADASGRWNYRATPRRTSMLSAEDASLFVHRENDFNAFSHERMLPHMLSTQGPTISAGDFNGDGLEDFFIGGAAGQAGAVFIQGSDANFKRLQQPALDADAAMEDTGSAILDANGDGYADLVVVSGGQQHTGMHPMLRPRLYLNNGRGRLHAVEDAFKGVFVNGSCVRAADINGDGAPDLFIGGRTIAGHYGYTPQSYLLINNGHGFFEDASALLRPEGAGPTLGMVTDAAWVDLNRDERPDLVVVGEWMPVTVLLQDPQGAFRDSTAAYGMAGSEGWWNCIYAADFDGDGDQDFIVGNLGLNARLRATAEEPVSLFAGDIDQNGGIDHLLLYYNQGVQHPFISRDQLVKQLPSLKRDFLKYSTFRTVRREQIISDASLERCQVHHAHTFASSYIQNNGDHFTLTPLPAELQTYPVFGIEADDFNHDGHLDFVATGNLFAVQPDYGRYDAGYGSLCLGDGQGAFRAVTHQESGFLVRGEGRALRRLRTLRDQALLVGRNNDSLLVFRYALPEILGGQRP